jgi:hypothetical protein
LRVVFRLALRAYPGVTRFSDYAERYSRAAIIRLARESSLLDELIERTTYHWGGRRRTQTPSD